MSSTPPPGPEARRVGLLVLAGHKLLASEADAEHQTSRPAMAGLLDPLLLA